MKSKLPIRSLFTIGVEIGSDAVAFSEVSGLSIGFETTTYKESPVESSAQGPRVMHMAQATRATVTLKKGLVRYQHCHFLSLD
ncbi:MAG: hypothetical protein U0401_34410 [Anaerolineae bacterium]